MTRTTRRYRCAEPDCPEFGLFDYSTQREAREHAQRLAKRSWRCTRHTRPSEVLSTTSAERVMTLTAERSRRYPDLTSLFWREQGAGDVGSGFTFGPGFKAWADDFPEGTRLVVTARIEPGPAQAIEVQS